MRRYNIKNKLLSLYDYERIWKEIYSLSKRKASNYFVPILSICSTTADLIFM